MVVQLPRSLPRLLFGLLLGWLLPACTVASPTTLPAPTVAPPTTRVLTLWHALEPEQAAVLQGMADAWAAQQPEPAEVQLKRAAGEEALRQQLLAAVQTDTTPNLAFVQAPDIPAYVEADALLPLDPLVQEGSAALSDEEADDFYAQFFDGLRYVREGNNLFAWPTHRYQTLMFLNRTRAEELGGTTPPRSWDALVQLCAAHRAQGGGSCLAAFPTGNVAVLWVWGHGGRVVNAAGTAPAFQESGGVEVMRWLGALRAVDGVYSVPTDVAKVAAFTSGETLFTFDSTEAVPDYERSINSAFDMLVVPPPSGVATPVTVATGGSVAIFRSDADSERLGWSFLRYWTSTETNARWAEALGAYPVRRSALTLLAAQWPEFSRLRQAAEWLPYAREEPLLAAWPEIEQALADAMIQTISGAETPDDALAEAARKAEGFLNAP